MRRIALLLSQFEIVYSTAYTQRCASVPSIQILNRVPRSCSCGLFPWVASLSAKNIARHIFQLESELQNIPEASPSFSVSEKLARYGSSALSGVEHLTLLVGKESVALALIRHFGSLNAMARASFQELRQFLPRRQADVRCCCFEHVRDNRDRARSF